MIKKIFLTISILLISCVAFAGQIITNPRFQVIDDNGKPLRGGYVYSYAPGTTTAKALYSDEACTTPLANPFQLDTNGSKLIYGLGEYKINVKTSALAQVPGFPIDSIGISDIGGAEYYYPLSSATDQGVTGSNNTIKYYVDTIGATNKATIFLRHDSGGTTTTYTLTTSETITSNITIDIEPGAIIDGAGTLAFAGSPDSQIKALPGQQIFSTTSTVTFTKPGRVYVSWFGDDSSSIQAQKAVNSLTAGGEVVFTTLQHTITIGDTVAGVGIYVDKSNVKFSSTCKTELIHSGSDTSGFWFALGTNSSDTFTQVHDIEFDNLKMTGSATSTGGVQEGISIRPHSTTYTPSTNGSYGIKIHSCIIKGFTTDIRATGAYKVSIFENEFGDNVYIPLAGAGGYGVLTESSYDVKIYDNDFISSTEDRHAIYISVDAAKTGADVQNKEIQICHNNIYWGNTTVDAAYFRAGMNIRASDNILIDGNTIVAPLWSGISLGVSEGHGYKYIITNNIISEVRNSTASEGAGINFLPDATYSFYGVIAKDNYISELSSNAQITRGVAITNTEQGEYSGNIMDLYNSGSTGFSVEDSTDLLFGPNNIDCHSSARSAIIFSGDATNVAIHKQVVKGYTVKPIEVVGSPTLTNIHYEYPLRAAVATNGSGTITVVDTDEWITSVVSEATGGVITLDDQVPLGEVYLTITSTSSDPDTNYYIRSATGNTISIGATTLAGVAKPFATSALGFRITLSN